MPLSTRLHFSGPEMRCAAGLGQIADWRHVVCVVGKGRVS